MAFVLSQHIANWFKRNPGMHRTDQQGQRIVCPTLQKIGFPAAPLHGRPSHVTHCPFCQKRLGHVQPIIDRDHPGEFLWPTVA